jgi:hypothetical protein
MLFWLALAIALLSVIASALYGTLKGLEAFRAVKGLAGTVGVEVDRIATTSGEIERHLALAAEAGTRLDGSLARLRVSRARLNVLTSAFAEARAAVGRITSVVPRK